ncbi:MAG: NADH-quinone oxidoreductase subunit NuoN, partial [Gammaproteobacteria bacterium]|nr:NADH-quinone oxidoreductase subunit NuoN [Gammaproteobacteria bacterium]
LMLSAALGIMIMAGAGSLLTVYLGLELMSLSLYAMVAMPGREEGDASAEAAMKYFVLGAMASGLLLYGMSMLYGIGGTLELAELALSIGALGEASVLGSFALVFVIVGIAFKLGVVPFHMWVPDIYQGASTPVTLFIASAPKIGAFAMAMRLLADGLPAQQVDWQAMLAILALLSMAVGNIIAIAQSNLKRMLAYSTIAHMGFLLLGMLSVQASGYAASMFYVLVYALTTLGAFALIILISNTAQERDGIEDFAGLARTSPWFGFVLLILMFSLAGVPPFAGFWAKWFVIKEALAGGYTWLAVAAVLFSVIGAYYYLRMVKIAYFDAPADGVAVRADADMKLVLSVNGLAVLALGLAPGALMAICVTVTALYR